MPKAPVLFAHPSSLDHDTGEHPERAERMTAVFSALEGRDWLGWERRASPAATRAQLTAVHSPGYVSYIEEFSLRGGGWLDQDTAVSDGSFAAGCHAAGGAIAAVDALLGDGVPGAFALHRPPGHHAGREQAMGFCLFNSVAVAAQHALDAHGLERVLILDWDVHHGNGTNDIFSASREVLFVSIHQSPLWPPGSGASGDVGVGAGEGYTVNLPVPPGSGDEVFASLVSHVVVPLIESYRPQLVLISAGYDAHRDDPLAGCAVTESGFAAMAEAMRAGCQAVGAPLGCVLEGGYALGPLARSVVATVEALSDGVAGFGVPGGVGVPGEIAVRARERVAKFWPELS